MTAATPTRAQHTPVRRPGEEGYILLSVVILLALFVIAMAVAAPRVAKEIQRDRDLETMHRGKQYIRGIKMYYKKFNAYPPTIDAMVKTNEIRFLRKRYLDPVTGKDDWKPILFGQNKQPLAFGFFGQPLGGTGGNVIAGTGPSGGNGIGGSTMGNSGSLFGNSPAGTSGPGAPSGTFGGTDTSTGTTGGTGNGTGSGTSGSTDSSGNGSSGSGSSSGLSGQTFGGGGILGVSPASPKQSILVYKKTTHYNEWEFTYSPLMDMQTIASGSGPTGSSSLPTSGIGTPTTPTTPTNPAAPNNNGGLNPSPTPPDTPAPQPQQ